MLQHKHCLGGMVWGHKTHHQLSGDTVRRAREIMGGILGRRAWKTCQLPIGGGEEAEHGVASDGSERAK